LNADRRQTGKVVVALLVECNEIGLINDDSHVAVTDAIKSLQQAEFWQLKNQEKHEGKNASTDQQLAVCRIALPALEKAWEAWNADDFAAVITNINLAITTDGAAPKQRRRK